MPTTAAPDLLDDRIRGVPPGTDALPASAVGAQNWHPAEGVMSLPVLTFDEGAFNANRDLMLRYVREQGVAIAPHAKTPMCPHLAASLVAAGAWGTTVADIRQAAVMLRAGLDRLIVANEVGGPGGARRLARLAAAYPRAQLYAFADSPEIVAALAEAWRAEGAATRLNVLVEVGAARAGARDLDGAKRILKAILNLGTGAPLAIAGVGTYEGAAAVPDPGETRAAIDRLLALTGEVAEELRRTVGPDRELIVTAGGSGFFDRVVATLKPLLERDPNLTLVLRSGAIFFHDHGVYERSMAALDERQGFVLGGAPVVAGEAFRPALRIWAEVLSRPEPGLAICGMGMRDVSFDQDLPRPLRLYRDGRLVADLTETRAMRVLKLNDQHAYVALGPDLEAQVGDVIEAGISHPCTAMDNWRYLFAVDHSGRVTAAYPTFFG